MYKNITKEREEKIKRYFEVNYLDGYKIEQGATTLTAERCLEAIYDILDSSLEEQRKALRGKIMAKHWINKSNREVYNDILNLLT